MLMKYVDVVLTTAHAAAMIPGVQLLGEFVVDVVLAHQVSIATMA
jgi:hypothetical protein